jgi:signal peptidase I
MTADPGAAPQPSRARHRAVLEWVILIAVALAVALVLRAFLFQLFYIPSESMVPRLEIDDQVVVNKLAYDFGDPQRGDVVVFARPPEWKLDLADLVKRIVGLPGETIEGRDGHVYIDGRRLPEPYLPPGTVTSTFGPIRIPAGHYFMMGDNRTHSGDSRLYGAVDGDEFVGKVFMTVWPITRVSVPGVLIALIVGGAVVALAAWWIWGRRSGRSEPAEPAEPAAPGPPGGPSA